MRYLMVASSVVILMIIMFEVGKLKGYNQGMNDALATNPPSEDLELVCAGLWVGEQSKKYWKEHGAK